MRSYTILTCAPNAFMAPIHNRMPAILLAEQYARWIDPAEQAPAQLNDLLQPYPPELMTAYAVSRYVNRPQNDSPECIVPAGPRNP